jgi:hypothetical protein
MPVGFDVAPTRPFERGIHHNGRASFGSAALRYQIASMRGSAAATAAA